MDIKIGDYYERGKVVDIDGVLSLQTYYGIRPVGNREFEEPRRSDKVIYECDMEAIRIMGHLTGVRTISSFNDRVQIGPLDYIHIGSLPEPYRIQRVKNIGGLIYTKYINEYESIFKINMPLTVIPCTDKNIIIMDRIEELSKIREYEYNF